jgi:hypothetical protein
MRSGLWALYTAGPRVELWSSQPLSIRARRLATGAGDGDCRHVPATGENAPSSLASLSNRQSLQRHTEPLTGSGLQECLKLIFAAKVLGKGYINKRSSSSHERSSKIRHVLTGASCTAPTPFVPCPLPATHSGHSYFRPSSLDRAPLTEEMGRVFPGTGFEHRHHLAGRGRHRTVGDVQ